MTDASVSPGLHSKLARFLAARERELESVPVPRQELLGRIAAYIAQTTIEDDPPMLVFVCTHNSRRSQIAQILGRAASIRQGLRVNTFSCGTEVTAFNLRAVRALERAGVEITHDTATDNTHYRVIVSESYPPMRCYSKLHDAIENPLVNFAAVMVCDDADRACPTIRGASARFALPYVDPKAAEGTDAEERVYDERCAEIAREMLWLVRRASELINDPSQPR